MASEVPSSLRHCVSHYNSVVSPTLVPWAPMEIILKNSLAVQWLGLYAFTAGATGLIPSQRVVAIPKHSNLNKMKRQRNIQQVKEHDKCPPNQTKEEIGTLPEKYSE